MAAPVIQVENLTKSFGDRLLFGDLTFGISEGEKIGLVARTGTGKTPLLKILAGEVHRTAVGQVSAVVQVHAQHRVAGLAQRHIDGVIGLSPRVRLNIGKLGPEQLARPLDGQILRHVHTLAAGQQVVQVGVVVRCFGFQDRHLFCFRGTIKIITYFYVYRSIDGILQRTNTCQFA